MPTSKLLSTPVLGRIGPVNSFPAAIALNPDGQYAAILNDGYGTEKSQGRQSITILNLASNRLRDFPDSRLMAKAHQSYFLGLAFGSDGRYLYASVASITDPTGSRNGATGNGLAVYRFDNGALTPERFIQIQPQKLESGKRVPSALSGATAGNGIPYPAGLAMVSIQGHDRLLVANDLSDNVLLLDSENGAVLEKFDLSTRDTVPASFPYTVVATRDGRHAWCSLWNASKVAELDLVSGRVTRWIPLLEPQSPTLAGSHPSALLLSPDEQWLYVALSNVDTVAVVRAGTGEVVHLASTKPAGQKYGGSYPDALAQSRDGKRV
ncbi:MAG: phosphoesterase, partial [Acidobacteria bacterium]|nr:phosphoesterase [Acidobacteriota bacterium]